MGSLGSTGISNTSEGWTLPKVTEGIPYSGLLYAKRKTNVICRKGSYNLRSEVVEDCGEAHEVWLLCPTDTTLTELLARKTGKVAKGRAGWEAGILWYTHVRTSFNFFWAALGASSSEFFPLERARAAFFSFWVRPFRKKG